MFIVLNILVWGYIIIAFGTMMGGVMHRATSKAYLTEPSFAEVLFIVIEALVWPATAVWCFVKAWGDE